MGWSPRGAGVRLLAVLAVLLPALGCDGTDGGRTRIDLRDCLSEAELHRASPRQDAGAFLFGFDHRASPEEDARQYIPFLDYLSRATGYRFRLRFTPKGGDNVVDDLGAGRVQFAAVGAGSYLLARERYGVVPLARGVNGEGRTQYRAAIVVPIQSRIRRVEDLKGRRFAFGDFTSTQGHVIPRTVLREHGLALGDLASYEYTGSHRNAADAVASGRADAAGMQEALARELAAAGVVRILYTSRLYPSSGIAANPGVPPDVYDKVQRALLDFRPTGRDARSLYHWDRTEMPKGFVAARAEDYTELSEWMRAFGLLAEPR